MTHVYDDTYSYLELCIISMGHKPIPEAGPVRVIMFESQEDKEIFRLKFDGYFKVAQSDLKNMGGMTPSNYYRMECKPYPFDTCDDSSSHSVVLSISINSEISEYLWVEHLQEYSSFSRVTLDLFHKRNHEQFTISFRKAKTRDRYIRQLNQMMQEFNDIQC